MYATKQRNKPKKDECTALGAGNRGSYRGKKKREFLVFKQRKVQEDQSVGDLESPSQEGRKTEASGKSISQENTEMTLCLMYLAVFMSYGSVKEFAKNCS